MPNKEFWPEEEVRKYTTEMKAVTITVNFTVEGKQMILSLDNFEKLLRKAYRIAITDCEGVQRPSRRLYLYERGSRRTNRERTGKRGLT